MVAISISVEAQFGLTWPSWKQFVAEVEALGFTGLFRSDHFTVNVQPPEFDSLELITSLTYLADRTQRVHFGPLVAPLSFRDAVMLARQALALDDLSDGRMILGIGAGWNEREHQMFGYHLDPIPARMARFAEGLEVITRLLQSNEPVSYEGRFYQLRDAILLPRPQRSAGPPILIGGNGPKRTLPLVARYADIWNGHGLTPETFQERSALLDELLRHIGRPIDAVKRTLTLAVVCGRTPAELERQVRLFRRWQPNVTMMPLDDLLRMLRTDWHALVGSPEEIIGGIETYVNAGVEELIFHWVEMDDVDGLRLLAEEVLPHVQT